MVMSDIVHLFFPFVSHQLPLAVYIISLADIIAFIGVVVEDPAYGGTGEALSVLGVDLAFIEISCDLSNTPAICCHLKNLLDKPGIFIWQQHAFLAFPIAKATMKLLDWLTFFVFPLTGCLRQPSGGLAFCLSESSVKSKKELSFLGKCMDFLEFEIDIYFQGAELARGFQYGVSVAGKTGDGFGDDLAEMAVLGVL